MVKTGHGCACASGFESPRRRLLQAAGRRHRAALSGTCRTRAWSRGPTAGPGPEGPPHFTPTPPAGGRHPAPPKPRDEPQSVAKVEPALDPLPAAGPLRSAGGDLRQAAGARPLPGRLPAEASILHAGRARRRGQERHQLVRELRAGRRLHAARVDSAARAGRQRHYLRQSRHVPAARPRSAASAAST